MHRFDCRVYYEDTDMAGIVYHANFLKFIERGRSEWVASLGLDQREMKAREGQAFVVRRLECDYLSPAYYGDDLTVLTAVDSLAAPAWCCSSRSAGAICRCSRRG